MEKGFAACQHDLFDTESADRGALALQPLQIDLPSTFALPNIAHNASTVAVLMHVKQEDRNTRQPVRASVRTLRFNGQIANRLFATGKHL